ncbi:MAG: biopolymer transport protein ExbB [Flavobacteriales bacterium]|jgi:biopolymer transport protein ExbB
MKKVFTLLAVSGLLTFGLSSVAIAQASASMEDSVQVEEQNAKGNMVMTTVVNPEKVAAILAEKTAADKLAAEAEATRVADLEVQNARIAKEKENDYDMMEVLKKTFIDGGAVFMSIVLICLIIGLALSIERIIYLTMATSNPKTLLAKVEEAMDAGGVDAAKEVCRNTRGPVASIFYQGLDRADEGIDMAEKSVISYGGVQMGQLEKGLPWIGLMIALAPMLGFMGTVIGMIQTFNLIETSGEADPSEMAGGIKVALITTVSGLVVAIILQVFYNYIVSKIDSLVNEMEDASISLIDILVKHGKK